MNEKDYYPKIKKYYTQNATQSMAIEVKITKTKSLPFSCLPAHQEEKLLESERAFAEKIADVGVLKKPYDIMLVHRAKAILVVIFYEPRKSRVYELNIRDFIHMRETMGKKSATEEEIAMTGILIDIHNVR